MRGLLAFLFFFSVNLNATAPGTLALYNFSPGSETFDESGNGYTLTVQGTPSYNVSYACGSGNTNSYGPTSSGNYLYTNNNLKSAMNGLTSWTVELYHYTTAYSSFPGFWGSVSGAGIGLYMDSSVNKYRLSKTGWGDIIISPDVVPLNACTHIALTCDGVNVKFYVNNTLKYTGAAFTWPNENIAIAAWPGGSVYQPNAYFSNVRFSNISRSSFPTTDTPSGALSPYMRQSLSPFVSPWVNIQ